MSRLLLLAQSPLPPELSGEGASRLSAPGIRGWHFALALREAGHEVALVAVRSGAGEPIAPRQLEPGLTLYPTYETAITGQAALERLVAEFKPDGAVAASVWPSYLAALFLPPTLPLWGDLFGSPLAEGQAKAVQTGDDDLLEPYARFEQVVLGRADVVSTVSTHQEYATVGAMATHGRLNHLTDGYRLAYTIPATLDPQTLPAAPQPLLRGSLVPAEAFVVLWSGGFNTWTDIDTLFAGLEVAMQDCPTLHFVATGGALLPHDSQTYPRFQKLVATSANHERYHLLGWVNYSTLHNYYLESDLGIILDRWSYEGVLGSRTRLLDWLLYGLPAVVTVTAQLTEELVAAGLAFSFPHQDSQALAALLVRLAGRPAELVVAREQARQYVRQRYAYREACQPLLDWAAHPRLAPDAGHPRPGFLSGATTLTHERQLADYRAQLEAKNTSLTALEAWAHEMETRLKNRTPTWRSWLKKLRPSK